MAKNRDKEISDARSSLLRMQQFDVKTLSRDEDLGNRFSFQEVLSDAKLLKSLYMRLPESVLDDLPETQLRQIRDQANTDYSRFEEILNFDPIQGNAAQVRTNQIQNIANSYQGAFNVLHPFISYSLYKTTDFKRLDDEAHSTLQLIKDQASNLTKSMETQRDQAAAILEEVRKVAAEQGVSQQAIYFKESADNHETQAILWQNRTVKMSIGLGLYAVGTLFFHKIPWLIPTDNYQTVQFAVSKILVFTVMSYMLYLCARNFLSHKHNAIIDKHRQNALLTYTAIIEAAGELPNREIILVQAAACIFSPQNTGYTASFVPPPPGAQSVIEFLSKPVRGEH